MPRASKPDRVRLWELVEILEAELTRREPDWQRVKAAAKELSEHVEAASPAA